MFDSVALKALSYFPVGNQVTNAVTNTNNFYKEGITRSNNYQMDFRTTTT